MHVDDAMELCILHYFSQVDVPGEVDPSIWQGVFHVFNDNNNTK